MVPMIMLLWQHFWFQSFSSLNKIPRFMALQGEVNGVIPNIRNVLIALNTQMTLKMGDEVWNGTKPGFAIAE